MRKIIFALLVLCSFSSFAQVVQTSYVVPSIATMKTYYGYANRMHVTANNSDYVICSPCTTDEVNIFAGAGGRKWMKVSDSAKAAVGGSIPTLNQVADASIGAYSIPTLSNRRMNIIDSIGGYAQINVGDSDLSESASLTYDPTIGHAYLSISTNYVGTTGIVNLHGDSTSGTYDLYLPANNGVLLATVNGQHPTSDGNVNVVNSYTASRGLNIFGNSIRIGGILDSVTNISLNGNEFSITDPRFYYPAVDLSYVSDGSQVGVTSNDTSHASYSQLFLSSVQYAHNFSLQAYDHANPTNQVQIIGNGEGGTITINSPLSIYQVSKLSADPTTTQIPIGYWGVFNNTTSGHTYMWSNIGGTLFKVQLL